MPKMFPIIIIYTLIVLAQNCHKRTPQTGWVTQQTFLSQFLEAAHSRPGCLVRDLMRLSSRFVDAQLAMSSHRGDGGYPS